MSVFLAVLFLTTIGFWIAFERKSNPMFVLLLVIQTIAVLVEYYTTLF